jgi:hypothetical protein
MRREWDGVFMVGRLEAGFLEGESLIVEGNSNEAIGISGRKVEMVLGEVEELFGLIGIGVNSF